MRGVRPQPTSTVTMGSEMLASIPKELTMGARGDVRPPNSSFLSSCEAKVSSAWTEIQKKDR